MTIDLNTTDTAATADTTADGLTAVDTVDGVVVRDAAGGVWHPTQPGTSAADALALCRSDPMAGTWKS